MFLEIKNKASKMIEDKIEDVVVLKTALAAIIYEAKMQGVNIEQICQMAKDGLFDGGKPYRWASALVVTPAREAIDNGLEILNS